ncbi:hypothetical protein BH09MYX1_BH09MYX1_39980 [soil metagenome]
MKDDATVLSLPLLIKPAPFDKELAADDHLIDMRGIGLVTGDSGSGKTTTCRKLVADLHDGLHRILYVVDDDRQRDGPLQVDRMRASASRPSEIVPRSSARFALRSRASAPRIDSVRFSSSMRRIISAPNGSKISGC